MESGGGSVAIRILSLAGEDGEDVFNFDYRGLPWIQWAEDRSSGKKTVHCMIVPGDYGELLIQTDGSMLNDPVYYQRPWEKLVGFRPVPASELYYSGVGKRLLQEAMKEFAILRVFGADDGVVMLADFCDDRPSIPMHLNYGVGTPVEVSALHDALYSRFISQRQAVVDTVCNGEFKWPKEDRESVAKAQARRQAAVTAVDRYNRKNSFWGKLLGRR